MAPTPTQLTIAPASAAFTAIGQTARLSVEVIDQLGQPISNPSVTWPSADGAVATVDASGLVTAAGNGETTVTATSGAASGSARLTGDQVAASVAVSPAALAPGDTLRLTATATDANGHAIAAASFDWTSSAAAVASVDDGGLVRARAEGTATVTATSGGAAGTAAITVGPPQPPPDLGGAYTLHSIAGAATGGVEFIHPAASGTLELTQEAPSGGSATGRYTVNVTTPVTTITDQGTFTVHRRVHDGVGAGLPAHAGDVARARGRAGNPLLRIRRGRL